MPVYYCDCDLASGNNDGTSWANAWQTFQRAVDGTGGTQPTAGDTVYCKGTDSISAAVDMDGNPGTYNGGYVKFIGVNAATTNEPPQSTDYGEYFVIDGGNQNINGIDFGTAGKDFIWLANFKITQCDGTYALGIGTAQSDNCVFNNIWCHDNAAYGIYDAGYFRYALFFRCRLTSNTSGGHYRPANGSNAGLIACSEYMDNTGRGVDQSGSTSYYGCIFHGNTTDGLYAYNGAFALNCIFDANDATGLNLPTNFPLPVYAIGCRFTNHSGAGDLGLAIGGNMRVTLGVCYFGNNATDITSGAYDDLRLDGVASIATGGSDTNQGYTTAGSDWNLRSDATYRSVAVPLD